MPELEGAVGNRWLTTLTFEKADPEHVRKHLESYNLESRPLWKPMHLQPLFSDVRSVVNGVSEQLFKTGLCLPSGSQMTQEDVVRVSNALKEALG